MRAAGASLLVFTREFAFATVQFPSVFSIDWITVYFGFVGRAGDSAELRGGGFQAKLAESDSAEIGLTPWGTVPHFVPQEPMATAW